MKLFNFPPFGPTRRVSWKKPKQNQPYNRVCVVTSAELLALHATPIEILPRPHRRQFYVLKNITFTLIFNTTAYTIGPTTFLRDPETDGLMFATPALGLIDSPTNAQVSIDNPSSILPPDWPLIIDQPLTLAQFPLAPFTAGDSTLTVEVTYYVYDYKVKIIGQKRRRKHTYNPPPFYNDSGEARFSVNRSYFRQIALAWTQGSGSPFGQSGYGSSTFDRADFVNWAQSFRLYLGAGRYTKLNGYQWFCHFQLAGLMANNRVSNAPGPPFFDDAMLFTPVPPSDYNPIEIFGVGSLPFWVNPNFASNYFIIDPPVGDALNADIFHSYFGPTLVFSQVAGNITTRTGTYQRRFNVGALPWRNGPFPPPNFNPDGTDLIFPAGAWIGQDLQENFYVQPPLRSAAWFGLRFVEITEPFTIFDAVRQTGTMGPLFMAYLPVGDAIAPYPGPFIVP